MSKNKPRYRVTICPPNTNAEKVFAFVGQHWTTNLHNFMTKGFGKGGFFFIYIDVVTKPVSYLESENAGMTEYFKRY